jgi:hypothetical protein
VTAQYEAQVAQQQREAQRFADAQADPQKMYSEDGKN